MIRILWLIFFIFSISNLVFAQCPWLHVSGSDELEDSWNVTTDSNNDIFVAGKFFDQTVIGGTTLVNSYSSESLYVQKLNTLGVPLNVIQIETDGTMFLPPEITYMNGDLYVALSLWGTLYANGNSYVTDSYDPIILKIDINLTTIQVAHFTGTGVDRAAGILADPLNNQIYICGDFQGNLTFGSQSFTSTSFYDGYLVALDNTLTPLSSEQFISPAQVRPWTMALDNNQNLYVSGYYADMLTVGGVVDNNPLVDYSPFLAKFNSAGNVQWIRGGASNSVSGFSTYYDLAIDPSGNIYLSGFLAGEKIFGATILDPLNGNCVLMKYDPSGNLLWHKQEGISPGLLTNWGSGIEVDQSGNIFWLGNITDDVVNFNGTTLPTRTGQHTFFARYDPTGTFLNVDLVGLQGSSVSYAITLDQLDNVLIAGQFFEGTNIDIGSTVEPNPALGSGDESGVYVYKACNTITATTKQVVDFGMNISPNPADEWIQIDSAIQSDLIVEFINLSGQVLYRTKLKEISQGIDVTNYPAGIYLLRFWDSITGEVQTVRIVIQ